MQNEDNLNVIYNDVKLPPDLATYTLKKILVINELIVRTLRDIQSINGLITSGLLIKETEETIMDDTIDTDGGSNVT